MGMVPPNAIVFAEGDQAVFTMWYFQFVLHERPDLIIIAADLLHFDWYLDSLHSTYPSLTIPRPYPWPETMVDANPTRAVCYVEYLERAQIDCSQPDSLVP